jgi:tetratricopeptide (TPR) repeat protein
MTRGLCRCAEARFLADPCDLVQTEGPWVLLARSLEAFEGQDLAGVRVGRVDVAGDWVQIPGQGRLAIQKRERLLSPLLAVKAFPWRHEPLLHSVAVMLPDQASYRSAMVALLTLGQERLSVTRLEGGGILLVVEDPSYFLVQRWHEEEGRVLFWRGEVADVFFPWGREHPLQHRVRGLELGEGLFFLLPEGGWRRLPKAGLRDVYEGLEFALQGRVEIPLPTREGVPRVPVVLHWGFRPTPGDASLWLLPEDGVGIVQGLLDSLSEVDLQDLQLAVVREGENDFFFLRRLRRRRGKKSAALELPGDAYATYAGYGNLFLPVDRRLEPPIRKERFRDLLGLRPGELVVLRPGKDEELEVLRLDEVAFRELESLVDYRIEGATRRLEEIVRASVFEFEPLEYLPVREPDREAASPSPSLRSPVSPSEESAPEASVEPSPPSEPPPPLPEEAQLGAVVRRFVSSSHAQVVEAEDVPIQEHEDPDLREIELQDAALEEGSARAWEALAAHQRRIGKTRQALFSLEEALWRSPDDGGMTRQSYQRQLALVLGLGAGTPGEQRDVARGLLTRGHDLGDVLAPYLAFGVRELPAGGERQDYLVDCDRAMRHARLRRKSRWLAWSEIIAVTRDQAGEEAQREGILGSLAIRGLDPEDRPGFLGRYLRTRAGLEEWSEQVDLPALLDLLERAAGAIAPGPYRTEARGLFLRTCMEADREGRERGLLTQFEELMEGEGEASLVAMAHHAGALGSSTPQRAQARFREFMQRLGEEENPSDRLFVQLFQNLLFAEGFSGVQSLLPEALGLLQGLIPGRRARVLSEVMPFLVELGARREAVTMARDLLRNPVVASDLFLVESVAGALKRGLDPDTLSSEDWARLGNSLVASKERFDILYLDILEEAVVALGEEFVARLEPLADPGGYSGMILTSCRLRLMAEGGHRLQGLDLVETSLQSCWTLSDPERSRALGRFLRAVAYLGNVTRGSKLLHQVIEKAYALENKELEDFYRSEILGEVARAMGELGDPEQAVRLLTRILEGVEERLDGANESVSLLFEVLTRGIEVLLQLGEWRSAGPLVERIEQVVRERIASHSGIQRGPWFFLHRARITCARALLYMGREEAGGKALDAALHDFQRVSSLDRTDLLEEAAGVLAHVDGRVRHQALEAMVTLMEKTEDIGEYDRRRRSEVVQALATAIRPGADAYRREQRRWDALEARSIRRRVATSHPSLGRTGRDV